MYVCITSRSISNSRSSRSHFSDSGWIVCPGCPTHLDFEVTVRVNLLHSSHLSKGLQEKTWASECETVLKCVLFHLTHFPFLPSSKTAGMLDRFVCKLCITHRYEHLLESNILSTVERAFKIGSFKKRIPKCSKACRTISLIYIAHN